MPGSTPYDRTTPPSTPRTNYHSQTPRLVSDSQASRYAIDSRDAHIAASPPIPRTAPREYTLEDDLYYAFTRDAYLLSSNPAVRALANRLNDYTPQPTPNRQTPITQPKTIRPKGEWATSRPVPMLPTLMIPGRPNQMITQPGPKPLPRISTQPAPVLKAGAAKATEWAASLCRKNRSSIFNIDFSFSVASRRRSCDRTPQISPRTSTSSRTVALSSSSSSSSSPSSSGDSFKRLRVDSTGSDMTTESPFSKPPPAPSMRPRESPMQAPDRRPSIPSEAHPGDLVSFCSSSPKKVATATNNNTQNSSLSAYNLRLGTDAYHDYLATSMRRKSFPTGDWAARRVREEFKMLAKLEKLDAEARDFSGKHVTGRKRACTLERRDRTSRKSANRCVTESSGMLPSTPSSLASSTREFEPLRRTTSDPSTEAFLTHVRASLEARRLRDRKAKGGKWVDYPVFADESEKGFLNDEPL